MAEIADLTVRVTYTVGLGDLKVSDSVYMGLCKIQDEGSSISSDTGNLASDKDILSAYDWLTSYIIEKDSYYWEYEIIDMNVYSETHTANE